MSLRQVHEIEEAVLKLKRTFFPSNQTYEANLCHLAAA